MYREILRTSLVVLIMGVCLAASPFAWSKSSSTSTKAARTDSIGQGISAAVYVHPSPAAKSSPDSAIKKAFEEAKRLYKDLDAKSSGSVGQINKNAGQGAVKVDGPFLALLKVCMQISDWTKGLFDVVRGKNPNLRVNFETGEVSLPDKKAWVDFSGVRNGYVVDRMAGLLHEQGFTNFMIQSGDIVRTMGRDGQDYWRLNIPDPKGKGNNLCRVSLEASSVATANMRDYKGATARLGKNPEGPTDLQSVTVVTRNATNATALATTALLMGKSKAQAMFQGIGQEGFGAILEDRNGKIQTVGDVTAACFEE